MLNNINKDKQVCGRAGPQNFFQRNSLIWVTYIDVLKSNRAFVFGIMGVASWLSQFRDICVWIVWRHLFLSRILSESHKEPLQFQLRFFSYKISKKHFPHSHFGTWKHIFLNGSVPLVSTHLSRSYSNILGDKKIFYQIKRNLVFIPTFSHFLVGPCQFQQNTD